METIFECRIIPSKMVLICSFSFTLANWQQLEKHPMGTQTPA